MTRAKANTFVPRTVVRVDLDRIKQNILALKSCCDDAVRIMAVVKANAYGHGAVEVARASLAAGADFLAVVRVSEAVELTKAGIRSPILLFGDVETGHVGYLAGKDVRITLSSLADAERISQTALEMGIIVKAHIKVDTGMGRLGVTVRGHGDIPAAVETVRMMCALDGIEVEGIYTHFANADTQDKAHARQQTMIFKAVLAALAQNGLKPPLCHAANSAATIDIPEAHFDVVRPGIALYGLWPSNEVDKQKLDLKPAMSIVSEIIHIKEVSPGFKISYGSIYETSRTSRIATVPIGYADGYSRLLSSRGRMLVRGKRVPVVGRVCMDFTMIDVTDVPGAALGDEVVVMGCQGDACVSADEIARLTHTINYEVAASLTRRMALQYATTEGSAPCRP